MKLNPAREFERLSQAAADRKAAASAFERLPKGDLLLKYQGTTVQRLMNGVSLLVIEKSRRIGLTWAIAAYAVLKAAAHRSAGGMDAWYMGYDQDMAREFIEACAMWAKAFGIAAEAVDEEVLEDQGKTLQAYRIRFASGFKIVGLPSVARALRGKQGLAIIDEAAFHNDLGEVLKAAIAFLMWGGQVIIVSTHNGVANPFNILLDEVRAGRRKGETLTFTFDQAVADGLYDRVKLTNRHRGMSREEWIADVRDTYGENASEELDCIPKDGAGSWLDPAALAAAEHPDAGRPELYAGGLIYMGRDVARRRDLAVIHGFELVGDVLWMRHRWLERGATFRAQDDAAADIFRTGRVAAYWIDQTGMGEKVVEDEMSRYGATRVKGVLLTGPSRLDLAISFKDRLDRGLLRIPPDPALRSDYRAIKKQGGSQGTVRIVNADDEVHADEFWATALACRAADIPHQPYAYDAVRGREDHARSPLSRRREENERGPGGGGFRGFRY